MFVAACFFAASFVVRVAERANISKDSFIIYESTFYPGVTEEICLPIIEKISGKKCNNDFFLGYSPERVNPGDKVHTIDKIEKVVAGQNKKIEKLGLA